MTGERKISQNRKNVVWNDFRQKEWEFGVTETEKVREAFERLPTEYQDVYWTKIEFASKQDNGAAFLKHSLAAWFEISRFNLIAEQGIEKVSPEHHTVKNPDGIEYHAYTGSEEPGKLRKIKIENDIPLERDGKPFIYEAKYLPARPYGTTQQDSKGKFEAQNHDQLLKYQRSIETGIVAGATVEIQGRIGSKFLQWMYGSAINDPSPIPDVQVMYSLPLPSGKEYRATLKQARDASKHLRFSNDYRAYTAEDRHIIAGFEWALRHPDKSYIRNILSDTHVSNPSVALAPYLWGDDEKKPSEIQDAGLYREYAAKRLEGFWEAAKQVKPPLYNLVNTDTPAQELYQDEVKARAALESRVEQYQTFLRNNPEIAKIKKSYMLGRPGTPAYTQAVSSVVDNLLVKVRGICAFETERKQNDSGKEKRAALGWDGPEEGYSLDIDHIMIDVIMDVNKKSNQKGRSYESPDLRFMSIGHLLDYLENLDRRSTDMIIHDPKAKEGTSSIRHFKKATSSAKSKIEEDVLNENLARMKSLVAESGGGKTARAFSIQRKGIEKQEKKLALLEAERKALGQEVAIYSKSGDKDKFQQAQARVYFASREIYSLKGHLLDSFKRVAGKKKYEETTLNLEVREQNMVKFIYTIDAQGKPRFDEERFDSTKSGRSAHSEVAGGRNVYGAGECALVKIDGQWAFAELNNGSGHYRPHPSSLPYARNVFFEAIREALVERNPAMPASELETKVKSYLSGMLLVDSLARGIAMPESQLLNSYIGATSYLNTTYGRYDVYQHQLH